MLFTLRLLMALGETLVRRISIIDRRTHIDVHIFLNEVFDFHNVHVGGLAEQMREK